ncbi:MAG: iron ABC transporter permease [Candidatus Methanomethylicaceae archaeon]
MAWLLFGSFWSADPGKPGHFTLENYMRVFSSSDLIVSLLNSAYYALGAALISTLIGFALAWIVTRTNTPFRSIIEVMAVMPYMIPMLLLSISYVFLLSPRMGIINSLLKGLFNLSEAPFNIYSLEGMIWVMAIFEAPFSYLIISAALKNMDPTLEEAGKVAGSSTLSVVRRIVIPILMPALLASFMINVIRSLEILDIPAILGLPARVMVLPTLIYTTLWSGLAPDLRGATSISVILFALTAGLIYLYRYFTQQTYRYATIGGRGHTQTFNDIGKWRYVTFAFALFYFMLSSVLPLLVILFFSFMPRLKAPELEDLWNLTLKNYVEIFNYPVAFRAFFNSLFLSTAGASLAILLCFLVSYISVRMRGRGSGILETVASLPFATPSLVMAVGLMWAYLFIPIGIYGTIWILMVGYITRFLPFGIRSVSVSLLQIHKDLEDSSKVCGASWLRTLYNILLPLARPGIIAGWIVLAVIFLREFSISILLYRAGSEVLPVVIFDMYINGFWPTLSAIGSLMVVISLALTFIALRLGRISSIAG